MKKRIPEFKNESEERLFWQTHDSTEYVDWSKAERTVLPNLKPTNDAPPRVPSASPYFYSSRVRLPILLLACLFPTFVTSGSLCMSQILAGARPNVATILLSCTLSLLWLSPTLAVLAWPNDPLREKALRKYCHGDDPAAPIRVPKDWPDIDCPRSEIRRRLPVLGWPIGFLYDSKWDILDDLIRVHLRGRKEDIGEYWMQFPDYLPIVLEVQRILDEYCWGFPPVFSPEDEYLAVGQMLTGDLCEVEAVMAMEEKFRVRILAKRELHPAFRGSMLDVVSFLDSQKDPQEPHAAKAKEP